MIIGQDEYKYIYKCDLCGEEFSDYKKNRDRPRRYCSAKCFHTSTRVTPITRVCVNCNKVFTVRKAFKNQKFCCRDCSAQYRNKTRVNEVRTTKKGYRYIRTNGKDVKEHILIMENYLGRKLKPDEVVHHKDFNKSNNDISNLQLMTNSEHSRLHRKYEIEMYGKHKGCTGGWNKGLKALPYKPYKVKKVIRVEDGKIYDSTTKCAEDIGGFASCVWCACVGKAKSYKGYHFKYLEDKK